LASCWASSARALTDLALPAYASRGLRRRAPDVMRGDDQVALAAHRPPAVTFMGVGRRTTSLAAVARGSDMFACVRPPPRPPLLAFITRFGPINLRTPATPPTRARDRKPLPARARLCFGLLTTLQVELRLHRRMALSRV